MYGIIVSMSAIALFVLAGDSNAAEIDQQLIGNAISAAPSAIGDGATVAAVDGKGEMRMLREGRNGFTCLPDNPASPGNHPMCLDENGLAWAKAWMAGIEPPADKIGFVYMLKGGSVASNVNPKAGKPAKEAEWLTTGPHVMIFNVSTTMEGYPDPGDTPDASQPYLMWGGTPYAHLVIPVE